MFDDYEEQQLLRAQLRAALQDWLDDWAFVGCVAQRTCGQGSEEAQRAQAALEAAGEWVRQLRWQLDCFMHNVSALSPAHIRMADIGMLTRTRLFPDAPDGAAAAVAAGGAADAGR